MDVRLTTKLFDEIYAQARARRVTMTELVRKAIARYVEQPPDGK